MRNECVELEVKFLISNLITMKRRLEESGASLSRPRTFELNLRFDTFKSDLRRESKILRLRQDNQNFLTYKGPTNVRDGIQQRTEIEFSVSDFERAQRFLEALGYQVCMVYEKYRTNYARESITISLDETPFGDFIEIEGPNPESINNVAIELGLNLETRINSSYAEIFERVRQILGLTFRDLTFVNFSGIQSPLAQLTIYPADQTSSA
jgi:adenylate cyclase class 2